jgi:ACS family hexuronate transporter-like MFS transporter
MRTAVLTLPFSKRSRGIAVAYSGGSLGAMVTPLLVTPLAASFGWRAAFLFTGVIGLSWVALWSIVSRRLPSKPKENIAFKSRIAATDTRLWAFMAAYALGALPLAFVIYGAALFLANDRGLSQETIGKLLWIPPLGWEVGYFFWGWSADYTRSSRPRSFRWLMGLLTILSLPLALTPSLTSIAMVLVEMFFAMFVAAGFVILPIAYASDTFSSDHAGLIAGAGAGSWSAVVALVMPVFGRLFDAQRYDTAFLIAACFPIAGFTMWIVLSRMLAQSFRDQRLAQFNGSSPDT